MESKKTSDNEERIIEMVKMRASGDTFQKIADKYGVSRQYAQQAIADFVGRGRKTGTKLCAIQKTIYPNLGEWMIESGISMIKLSEICGLNTKNCSIIRQKMLGKVQFKLSQIKAILKESGKTFEYMFVEKAVGNEAE